MVSCGMPSGGGRVWIYQVIEDAMDQPPGWKTYGLAVYRSGKEVSRIRDISTDRQLMLNLAVAFTENGLEPVQFAEVVQDVLACPDYWRSRLPAKETVICPE